MSQQRKKHKSWACDQDYLRKLSPEERAWLFKFNKEYYEGRFAEEPILPLEEKKECSKRRDAMERDAMRGAVYINVEDVDSDLD